MIADYRIFMPRPPVITSGLANLSEIAISSITRGMGEECVLHVYIGFTYILYVLATVVDVYLYKYRGFTYIITSGYSS